MLHLHHYENIQPQFGKIILLCFYATYCSYNKAYQQYKHILSRGAAQEENNDN